MCNSPFLFSFLLNFSVSGFEEMTKSLVLMNDYWNTAMSNIEQEMEKHQNNFNKAVKDIEQQTEFLQDYKRRNRW